MKILHTGDWHIGNFPGPEKNGQNLRYLDIVRCLYALCEEAERIKPDLIIVAGDIFHQARVWSDRGLKENQTAVQIIRLLENVAPVIVMRGTPNHDSEEQFKALESTFYSYDTVHIVTEPRIVKYYTGAWGWVQVACVPGFDRGYYRAKHPGLSKEEENEVFTKAVADMIIGLKAQMEPEYPSVLVSHFTITGCNMESGQTAFFSQFEPVVYPDTLTAADYDLVCFGHIHRPQQLDGCKNTFYCGAVSALNFNDEGQQRGFYVHDINGGKCESTFHGLPTRDYFTIRLNDDDVREINENGPDCLLNLPCPDATEGKIIRVLYDCTDEHNKAFNHATLESWLYQTGKAFWVQEITPQKISITVDRKSMESDNTPEDNLRDYLLDKGRTPEDVVEILNIARPIISEAMEKATTERHTGTFVPVEIEVKNYRNYRDEKFSFDSIRFCTINGSNGVGKSSLFMDAMADALFEETREGELTGWICNDPDARSGSIKFTFRLGDRLYRVTRTRQKSGKATLNIAEQVDGEWEDRSKEKFRDTQAEIINIIGMDSLTLKACALIMQDQYGLFLQADKEARMNILGNILGLGIYGDMETLAAARATDTNREIRLLSERADTITAGLPDRNELATEIEAEEAEIKAAENEVAERTAELDSRKVALNTQLEAAARVIKLNGKITTLTTNKANKESQRTQQTALVRAANIVLSEEEDIAAGVKEYEYLLSVEKTLISARDRRDDLIAQRDRLTQKVMKLESEDERILAERESAQAKLSAIELDIGDADTIRAKHSEYLKAKAQMEEMQQAFDKYADLAKEKRNAEAELSLIDGQIKAGISTREYVIAELRKRIALLTDCGCPIAEQASCKFLADAMKAKEELPEKERELVEYRADATNRLAVAQKAVTVAEQALSDNEYDSADMSRLRAVLTALEPFEEKYNSLGELNARREAILSRIADIEQRVAEIIQAIKDTEAERDAVCEKLKDAETAAEGYDALVVKINNARQWVIKERDLPAAREKKAAAKARLAELATEIEAIEAEIEETHEELTVEQAKTVGTDELKEQVKTAEAAISLAKDRAQNAAMRLGGLKKQLEVAETKLKQAAEIQQQVNELAVKAAAYEELKKAFSQDGIPHNVIRSIIPVFEATATNILGQMSQGHMSVEFVTEKVLKSNSKKEVTTLDIIINDSDTGRLAYMSRSGGERVKAALSVILALAEIKSSKAGVQLGFLFIDEPPFLDAPGVQAYCDALEAIQRRYADLKVMAITHDPAMKSRFPQSVDVVKTAEGSKVIYE